MTVDGYIDDATDRRLLLSNDADLDRVDDERAASDAILIGANTIRRDDPRLLVRSEARRAERSRRSLTASPAKGTVTASGELSRDRQFFSAGGAGDQEGRGHSAGGGLVTTFPAERCSRPASRNDHSSNHRRKPK